MHELFSITFVIFDVFGYQMSIIELVSTCFGLAAVWLAARSNILTWPATIINAAGFFAIFYQVRLYSDMVLQLYFMAIAIYGWFFWRDEQHKGLRTVSKISKNEWVAVALFTAIGTALLGTIMSNIHIILPKLFDKPANYAYINALSATLSIIANLLMARRKLENWYLWIAVDTICVALYASTGILLMAVEYAILMGICLFGLKSWKHEYSKHISHEPKTSQN